MMGGVDSGVDSDVGGRVGLKRGVEGRIRRRVLRWPSRVRGGWKRLRREMGDVNVWCCRKRREEGAQED